MRFASRQQSSTKHPEPWARLEPWFTTWLRENCPTQTSKSHFRFRYLLNHKLLLYHCICLRYPKLIQSWSVKHEKLLKINCNLDLIFDILGLFSHRMAKSPSRTLWWSKLTRTWTKGTPKTLWSPGHSVTKISGHIFSHWSENWRNNNFMRGMCL
jgi:hypothetical protein